MGPGRLSSPFVIIVFVLIIRADHRSIRTRPEPEAHDRIVRRLAPWIRSELRYARDFARLEASSTWAEWGCASVVEYGTRHGYRAAQVRNWATLGKALAAVEELEPLVIEQRIPIEHAEIIAPALLEPTLAGERREWMDLAERTSARRLRRYVSRRLEEVRQEREDLEPLTLWTTRRTRHDWHRACDLVSMLQRKRVSEGEAFTYVLDFFLDRKDPKRRAERIERERAKPTKAAPANEAGEAAQPSTQRPSTTWPAPRTGGRATRDRAGGGTASGGTGSIRPAPGPHKGTASRETTSRGPSSRGTGSQCAAGCPQPLRDPAGGVQPGADPAGTAPAPAVGMPDAPSAATPDAPSAGALAIDPSGHRAGPRGVPRADRADERSGNGPIHRPGRGRGSGRRGRQPLDQGRGCAEDRGPDPHPDAPVDPHADGSHGGWVDRLDGRRSDDGEEGGDAGRDGTQSDAGGCPQYRAPTSPTTPRPRTEAGGGTRARRDPSTRASDPRDPDPRDPGQRTQTGAGHVTGDLFAGRERVLPPSPPTADGAAREDGTPEAADASWESDPGRPDTSIPLGDPHTFLDPAARHVRPPRTDRGNEEARRRYVPAGVRRLIWLRAEGVCEVPGCNCQRNLQLCHIRAWARGGANGRWNLLLLCPRHHLLLDAGQLRFLRWADDGRPTFRLPGGGILTPEARAPPGSGPG